MSGIRGEFAAVLRDRRRSGLVVCFLLLYLVASTYQQVVPLYYKELGVSIVALGLAKSGGNVVEAVASTPAGVLADRIDRAAIIVVAGLALAVALLVFPLATSALALGLLVVAFAAARLVFNVAAQPLLDDSFTEGSEGVGWATRDVAIYAGGAIGLVGAGLVTDYLTSVRPVFLALIPAIVLMVAILVYTHRPSLTVDISRSDLVPDWPSRPLAPFRELSHPRVLLRFLVVDAFSALGMGMCFYLVPVYAVDLGIGAGAFLLVFGGSHLFAIPFTVAGGVLTDCWNRKALFVGNYAIEVAMLAAFALAGGRPLFVVGIALFVLQTTFEPAVLAYFFDQFDESEAATAWGLDGTVTRGIGILAPPIGAAVYGLEPRFAFGAGAVFMTLSTVVALTLPD